MTGSSGYELDDPRPIAAHAPYTFFLPSPEELAAIVPGDLVKLTVRAVPESEQWGAERIWFRVEAVSGDRLDARLESDPEDIPALKPGDRISFLNHHIIDCIWEGERETEPPPSPPVRTYWQRCLVDCCVTVDGAAVHFLYREEPEPTEGDRYPDSGWRIRGDSRDCSDAEIDARETEFVALGRVLNADDSWLHLIDAPVGSSYVRDWESDAFVSEK